MRHLFLVLCASVLLASCTEEALIDNNEPQQTETGLQEACLAPDTNCNGIPDHEE